MNQPKTRPRPVDERSVLGRVCELWGEILNQPMIDPDQHFFLAGGDSLQLARLLMRLQTEWGVELSLMQLWDFSTPRKMAQCCHAAGAGQTCRQAGTSYETNDWDFPASCSQQGLWFSELQADNRGLYNSGLLLELQGPLQLAVLEQALTALHWQFPLLHSCLQPDASGRHLRVIIPPLPASVLLVEPLPPLALDTTARRLLAQPFELGLGLWRCRLYRHGKDWHSLLLCCHHCLLDGWSGPVLLQQLALAYNALLADPHWSPSVRDAAFANHCWRQQQFLCSETHASNLRWWRTRLTTLAPLPATLPWQASARHWPYRLQSSQWLLPQPQLQGLQAFCAGHALTLFAALLTALACALTSISGHHQHVIAFPVAGRKLAEEECSVGCYMNLLPLRIDLVPDEPLPALLLRVQQEAKLAQAHAIPWQSLVQALRPPLLADGNAWSDVVLALQNFPAAQCDFNGLSCRSQPLASGKGQHLLKFEVTTTGEGLCVQVEHAEAVLAATVVEQLAIQFMTILQRLAQ